MHTFIQSPNFEAALPREAGAADEDRRQNQKMVALGRLACGVAHDFNNLLTVISGYSQLLLARGGPQHEMREELQQIQQATERAATVTRQLLYFGSKKEHRLERADLNELVSSHARTLRPLVGDAIQIDLALTEPLPAVEIHSGQLLQVLMNLAANARDAMPQGGQLRLTTELFGPKAPAGWQRAVPNRLAAPAAKLGQEAVQVVLRVTDTGCGMDADTVGRLFEPFFTTKASGKGTGLGLANVADIVKQMHGRIEVESEPGRGSSFIMYFPAAPLLHPQGAAGSDGGGAFPASETILVVEDTEYVRLLVERVLVANGYRVLAASNGPEALRLAEEASHPIDLLIADVVMPRMNGHQLAAALGALHAEMRVLYVSGYPASVHNEPVAKDFSDAFLQKPFAPEVLLGKVRELLAKPVST